MNTQQLEFIRRHHELIDQYLANLGYCADDREIICIMSEEMAQASIRCWIALHPNSTPAEADRMRDAVSQVCLMCGGEKRALMRGMGVSEADMQEEYLKRRRAEGSLQ